MTEPQYDSTGDPMNEAARLEVAAAQREAADTPAPDVDKPPPGSWRARLDDYEAETVTMQWDGTDWEIPAKMPNAYYEAVQAGDARGMVQSILGFDGVRKLRIPRDIDAENMALLAESVGEAAGKVWSLPNLSRSARRSQSTTRR